MAVLCRFPLPLLCLTGLLPSTQDRKTALPLPLGDAGKALKEDSPSSSANQRVPAWHEEKSGLEKGSKYDLTAEMPQRQSANNRRVIRQSLTHRDRVNETHTAPHRAARRSSCSSLDVSSPRFVEGVSPRVNPHYLGLGACLSGNSYVRSKSWLFVCCLSVHTFGP